MIAVFVASGSALMTIVGGLTALIERRFSRRRSHESTYRSHQHAHAAGTLATGALVAHSVLDGFALVGAALSTTIAIPTSKLGAYLGFFAGVLMYLATADVLPETHAQNSSALTLASTSRGRNPVVSHRRGDRPNSEDEHLPHHDSRRTAWDKSTEKQL